MLNIFLGLYQDLVTLFLFASYIVQYYVSTTWILYMK